MTNMLIKSAGQRLVTTIKATTVLLWVEPQPMVISPSFGTPPISGGYTPPPSTPNTSQPPDEDAWKYYFLFLRGYSSGEEFGNLPPP